MSIVSFTASTCLATWSPSSLSIQGTFLGPLQTPAGIIQPTGANVDGPCADFWYLRDGKIERFDCYIMLDTMRAQMGVS
jgi:hypothetical protein